MSEQDTSGAHGSATPPNKNNSQETLESSNKLRFILLFISIIISLLIAPFFLTDNIFKIYIFFATFTTLIFALTDLIIYLSKESSSLIAPQIDPAKKGCKASKNPLISSAKKVVHYIQRRQTGASRIISSILKNKWLIEAPIIVITFPTSLIVAEHWKDIIGEIATVFEFFAIKNKSLGISILATIIVALIIFRKMIIEAFQKIISSLTSKYFVFTLASLAIIGALSALLIPSYTSWFREPGYTSAQQESAKETPEKAQNTHSPTPSSTGNKTAEVEQKSTSDLRLHLLYITGGIIAILGLIETNRKNSQDHIREVHAARRTRYIEAVDKLSSKDAPVRLGGAYALVALVDEWLEDDNIDRETQIKEGQVIINNLCAYIRSPFTLAVKAKTLEADSEPDNYEGDFSKDQAAFHDEQDVRRAIFVEMSKRSSTLTENKKGKVTATPGRWSSFDFNFSRAPFFYPLGEIKFINANFNNAKFYGHTDFSRSQFYGETNMQHVDFYGYTQFDYTYFHNGLNLSFSHFHMNAGITSSAVREKGIFFETHFHKEAFFSDTDFLPEGSANFSFTKFHQRTVFNNTNFYGEAIFSADFMSSTSFEGAYFKVEPNFEYSYFSDKEEHNFETRKSSPYHIKTEAKNHEGKLIKLPVGAGIYTSNVKKNLPSNNSKNSTEL
ncbi:hypothetical protein O3667_06530 [Rothia mucilaginosa]|uniref:pentapeptide repeat-containing protein n=1 Tax=Rothia mucilaginosa TaxID=43675 RepID=UPI00352C3954